MTAPRVGDVFGIPLDDRRFGLGQVVATPPPREGEEAEWLPNRKIVAPVRLEKALRAKHGLEPWTEAYAELEPSLATTARLFD